MSNLKPCPFCGCLRVQVWTVAAGNRRVECEECAACGPEHDADGIKWNTRADSAALAAAVQVEREELIAMCRRLRKEADKGRMITLGGIIGLIEDRMSGGTPLFNVMDDSRPAPAVDVLGLISEFIEAEEAWRNDDDALTEEYQRMKRAYDALCALVPNRRKNRT